jgi:magnesium transporter
MIRSLLLHEGKLTDGIDPKEWKASSLKPGAVLWVDVEAPRRKTTKMLKEAFGFDDISLQDTLTFSLLPKLDTFHEYAFIVIHALGYEEASGEISRRELDVFIGKGYIVTVHLDPIPVIDKVFKEAQRSDAVMARGAALVAHVILDRLIDLSYEMVSLFDDDIEEMERRIAAGQLDGIVDWTLRVRRALLLMKKSIGPQRDVLNALARHDSPFIAGDVTLHFRDDYDRLARVYDQVDTNRELVAAAADAYRSMVSLKINQISLRTNAVIERLTLFATIFLPLTAIASWYGMNFHNMPELSVDFAYPLLFVLSIAGSLWVWYHFKQYSSVMEEAEHLEYAPKWSHEPAPQGAFKAEPPK